MTDRTVFVLYDFDGPVAVSDSEATLEVEIAKFGVERQPCMEIVSVPVIAGGGDD